jgi:hypothetical protein
MKVLHLHQTMNLARVTGRHARRVHQPVTDPDPGKKHSERKKDAKRFAAPAPGLIGGDRSMLEICHRRSLHGKG